jgi:anti-sigma regulatory factor (Ser/Thr protein kinase)
VTGEEYRLELPDRPDCLFVARVFIGSLALERAALPRDRADDLAIAVSEACTAAVEAYRAEGRRDGRIRLRCLVAPGRIEVFVDFDSMGAEAGEVTLRAVNGTASGGHESIGLSLMFALVDEAELRSTPTGTSVHLVTVS